MAVEYTVGYKETDSMGVLNTALRKHILMVIKTVTKCKWTVD